VLKVLTYILYAVNDGDLSVLALLDLSAAFDTVDHDILLTRLKVSFRIRGAALDWFWSYLTNRVECVRRGLARSTQDRAVWRAIGVCPGPPIHLV